MNLKHRTKFFAGLFTSAALFFAPALIQNDDIAEHARIAASGSAYALFTAVWKIPKPLAAHFAVLFAADGIYHAEGCCLCCEIRASSISGRFIFRGRCTFG